MLVDTHCHINIMIKEQFDVPLSAKDISQAQAIIDDAAHNSVSTIINVGTSIIESHNCIMLAQQYPHVYAAVGIHPNDATSAWQHDMQDLKKMMSKKTDYKIVGIGECGLDFHYPDYNKQQQYDVFKAHIELALEYDLALIIHSRDAYDETLSILEPFKHDIKRGVMHCFSYDNSFAQQVIEWHYLLGIGGTITYPRNEVLRDIVRTVPLEKIVLETDAPFLPPQSMRGKKNHPQYIRAIAEYIAQLKNKSIETIAQTTTANACRLFAL